MLTEGLTVFIIDDDPSVRDSLGLLLGLRGHSVALFADAESFLNAYRVEWAGCLLLDIRMPGMNGLQLQDHLVRIGCMLPVIVMTGHGDVDSARQAFLARAVDFLEKPLDQERLLEAVGRALQAQAGRKEEAGARSAMAQKLQRLTPRERQVMDLVVGGKHNRDIAAELGISVRTVEVHKARMMEKLGVEGLPQLMRLAIGLWEG